MNKLIIGMIIIYLVLRVNPSWGQKATFTEKEVTLITYPFFDPNPVPEVNRIYPYFYFNGYTNRSVIKKWKMIILENDYIQVYICPEIGGKIWGAIEKSTGKEFIYFNHVVKFRDVAMRGAWTSGGLEYNFGDIGHIPTCATPVDYVKKENVDGSVSCVVGAIDLPSGTKWNVEIIVHPGKAFFETKASWFNNTGLPCSYYHWMNAAAKSSGNLEFIYPGNKIIGHGGELYVWPEAKGRNISWYENNDFGTYKSYHVINSYSDFFGGYWHDDDFGFGHWGTYDDMPGKKLWIWGLSQQGMIWKDLLTDDDGQYIEFQSGKMFNQAASSSTHTPFKHREFKPHESDIMNEIWFPLKGTGGMVAASPIGVLNVEKNSDVDSIFLSALQEINDEFKIFVDGKLLRTENLHLKPLELYKTSLISSIGSNIKVIIGDNKLVYSSSGNDILVNRPVKANDEFNWESVYGLFVQGLEMEKQRRYIEAKDFYMKLLTKDPGFLPALNRVALAYYRQMNYQKALEFTQKALAIDTYDGESNYIFGLVNWELGNHTDAKSGFSIAMGSVDYRAASTTELANIFMSEKDYYKAKYYASKALDYNRNNLEVLETLAILFRKSNQPEMAKEILNKLYQLDATNHFVYFEDYLLKPTREKELVFINNISNEFPHESYLDLAINYSNKGCIDEAISVLKLAQDHPIINLWLAWLDPDRTDEFLQECLDVSPNFVFPHRKETSAILTHFIQKNNNWKLKYYQGLIYLNIGLIDEAISLFNDCGNEPDLAPFWLLKAKLVNSISEKQSCLQRAIKLVPADWRSLLALANFYIENNEPGKALEITAKIKDSMPEQSSIGLSYAKALVALGKYKESISFLEKVELLPSEGVTIGRDIYHESCLRLAFELFEKGNSKSVIKYAQKAKEWPANLGVGKPYDVDERLEDFITALAYEKLGNQELAKKFADNVMDYTLPDYLEENSKLYLQLLLLCRNGKSQIADVLLQQYKSKYPNNVYLKWVDSKIRKKRDVDSLEKNIFFTATDIQPYDTKFVDKEFKLLTDFFKIVSYNLH